VADRRPGLALGRRDRPPPGAGAPPAARGPPRPDVRRPRARPRPPLALRPDPDPAGPRGQRPPGDAAGLVALLAGPFGHEREDMTRRTGHRRGPAARVALALALALACTYPND